MKDSWECGCDIFIPLEPIIRGLARPGYCTDRAIHLDNITEIVFNSKSTLYNFSFPFPAFIIHTFEALKWVSEVGDGVVGGVYRPRIVVCPHAGSAIVGGRPGQSS